MDLTDRAFSFCKLGIVLLGISGCMENIALIGRPTIEEGQDDRAGEVEQVDLSAQRIYFRSSGRDSQSVAFSADATVLDRGRDYPVSRLRPGDEIAMQVKRDGRGLPYVDLIRLRDRVGRESRLDTRRAGPKIEILSGRVDSVNQRDQLFELDDPPRPSVLVRLSENIRESDRKRFSSLRAGEHVRMEGKFISPDRFELLSFLNDDS